MRILQIHSERSTSPGYGTARYVSELGRGLGELGHEVHILGMQAQDALGELGSSVRMHHTDKYPFFAYNDYLDTVFNAVPGCEKLVHLWDSSGPFDMVVGHDWGASLVAAMAQRVYSCPLVATLHGTQAGMTGSGGTTEQVYVAEMERWFVGRADRVVVLTETSKAEVERHYEVPGQKIEIVPGAAAERTFDTDVDRDDFRSMFAEPEEKIILFAGRLVPERGPDVLLAAMQSLGNHSPRVRLVLAGEGPMRETLLADAERCGMRDQVRLTGHLGPSVLGALYQVADVLAVPSRYHAFGWTALEAALHDLPIVASQCGGLTELARVLPTGAMVPSVPGDPSSLADGLSRVLERSGRDRRNPRPVGRRLPPDFTWERAVERTASVYQSIPVPASS